MERTRPVLTTEAAPPALPPVEVRCSRVSGLGCFATRPIHKGETIHVLSGEVLSGLELDQRISSGDVTLGNDLQINDDLFLLLNYPSHYFNHSCEPNAGMRGESELFAISDISEGEEVKYDYSTTIGINREPDWLLDNNDWSMQCNCRAEACRGQIDLVTSIPQETLQQYLDLGAFPDFIKAQLQVVSSPSVVVLK